MIKRRTVSLLMWCKRRGGRSTAFMPSAAHAPRGVCAERRIRRLRPTFLPAQHKNKAVAKH